MACPLLQMPLASRHACGCCNAIDRFFGCIFCWNTVGSEWTAAYNCLINELSSHIEAASCPSTPWDRLISWSVIVKIARTAFLKLFWASFQANSSHMRSFLRTALATVITDIAKATNRASSIANTSFRNDDVMKFLSLAMFDKLLIACLI